MAGTEAQKKKYLPRLASGEFMAAYSAALANAPRVEVAATRTRAGSVGAMVAGYIGSAAFHSLDQFVVEALLCKQNRAIGLHSYNCSIDITR